MHSWREVFLHLCVHVLLSCILPSGKLPDSLNIRNIARQRAHAAIDLSVQSSTYELSHTTAREREEPISVRSHFNQTIKRLVGVRFRPEDRVSSFFPDSINFYCTSCDLINSFRVVTRPRQNDPRANRQVMKYFLITFYMELSIN